MPEKPGFPSSVDEYIARFPADIQRILEEVRRIIREVVPDVEEVISYQMPTYRLHGNLVHFAAHKNHIGFYPTPSGIEAFVDELTPYQTSKGAVQFPLDQPIPYDIIRKIVAYRREENLEKARKGRGD
jgi:uncharacterized protein YdhG (YjbR/CyaY superfamily)